MKGKRYLHCFFGCVLEETHDNTYLEDGDERKVLKMKGKRCFNFEVIVISLYVIKSQWKIKFNNKRYYHLRYFSFKPTINNIALVT